MDVPKQVGYWKTGAIEDMEAAKSLLEKDHLRHALFFAHLALEKALKAHVTRATCEVPPRIHNLARLAEKARMMLDSTRREFLLAFDEFQIEGRYPDMPPAPMDRPIAREKLAKAEEVLAWLTEQL